MPHTFKIQLTTDPASALAEARQAAARFGVTLTGDETLGQFSGLGIQGYYVGRADILTVTIERKPVYISNAQIEEQLTRYFAGHESAAAEPLPASDHEQGDLFMSTEHEAQAEKIIRSHVLWASGSGLIPLPLLDLAAIVAVQVGMLEQLSDVYDVRFTSSSGKRVVAALAGTSVASLGASFIKALPGIGTVAGVAALPVTAGASTYALGRVAANHFANGGDLDNLDLKKAKAEYDATVEEGQEKAKEWKEEEEG